MTDEELKKIYKDTAKLGVLIDLLDAAVKEHDLNILNFAIAFNKKMKEKIEEGK